MENVLQGNKVDLLTTKNLDMHLRRVVNASPSKDTNDYVIKSELTDVANQVSQIQEDIKGTDQVLKNIPINNSTYSAIITGVLLLIGGGAAFGVPGCQINLPQVGAYLVTGMFSLYVDPLDNANLFTMYLESQQGFFRVKQNPFIQYGPNGVAPNPITFSASWIFVTPAAGMSVLLTATKAIVTAGASTIVNGGITATLMSAT